MKSFVPLLFACAAVAACDARNPVDAKAGNTDGLPIIDKPAASATGARPANAIDSQSVAVSGERIPAVLHGRWGLAPADCTSTRGDAKGLLVVGPDEIRFYESRAVPGANAQTGTDSISGDFRFTSEGQTWTKFQALELQRNELVRTESNPMASFTYARCK